MSVSKDAKESFVRDLSGTTYTEVYVIVCSSVAWVIVRHLGLLSIPTIQHWHRKSRVFSFLWDFTTVLLPSTLAMTVLADYMTYFFLLWLALIILFLTPTLRSLLKHSNQLHSLFSQFLVQPYPSSLACVRETRVWTNIFTVIAILAVDFHIFPRRLAKVETYGTGLMDIGIGCFMICHGMVAREARNPEKYTSLPTISGYLRSAGLSVWKTWPFVLVGLLRLVSVKSTDYQEHVTEYGVHWNFFFTIVVVRVLATMLQPLISLLPVLPHGLAAILTACTYQMLLSTAGLREYVVYGPDGDYSRRTLLSANREGVVSCIGHLAIFLSGVEMGKWYFRANRWNGGRMIDMMKVAAVMALLCIFLVPITLWCSTSVENTSRRFANLTYCLWTVSMFGSVITINFLTDVAIMFLCYITHTLALTCLYSQSPPSTPSKTNSGSPHFCLISAIDYNQFVYFMLANVLTGLVNFTVDTLSVSSVSAITILVLYMITLSLVVTLLHSNRIKLI